MSVQLALVPDDSELEVVHREIVLPFLPPSKNKYDGWQPVWKSSARKKWHRHIGEKLAEQNMPKAKAVTVQATLVFGSKRRRDWQNYVHPLMYWVADSLVNAEVISDDTPDQFKTLANGGIRFALDRRKIDPKIRQRTIISYALEL